MSGRGRQPNRWLARTHVHSIRQKTHDFTYPPRLHPLRNVSLAAVHCACTMAMLLDAPSITRTPLFVLRCLPLHVNKSDVLLLRDAIHRATFRIAVNGVGSEEGSSSSRCCPAWGSNRPRVSALQEIEDGKAKMGVGNKRGTHVCACYACYDFNR